MGDEELAALLAEYRLRPDCCDEDVAFYRELPSLEAAIAAAALARTAAGKRHPHQRRLPAPVLAEARDALLARRAELAASPDFAAIIGLVRACAPPGFGELACYDTALRLGAWLGHAPLYVYLHAGTRKGAARLGLAAGREYLEPAELPAPLRQLEPRQVEDFLCIFKDRLRRPSQQGRNFDALDT